MTQKKWTDATINDMAALHAAGHTYKGIGQRFGCSHERVRQLLARHEREHRDDFLFDGLRLSTRLKNCLRLADCWTLDDAAKRSLRDWFNDQNFGARCAVELGHALGHRLRSDDIEFLRYCEHVVAWRDQWRQKEMT